MRLFAYRGRGGECTAGSDAGREAREGERLMQIGVAGLGRMGAAMAARLIEVGHQVTVWNRSPEKAAPLVTAGARPAASAAALADMVEVVITCLTNAEAIESVYGGPSGILSGNASGKLVIEMSTVRPGVQVALAEKVRAKGAAFIECPVGGSTGPAREGKLIGLMGAEPADAARARPILDQLCRRLEHCGPVGTGEIMKFTINLPLMIYWQALGEALALSRPLGIDPDRMMDLLSETSGGPNVLKVLGPKVAKMLKHVDAGAVSFDVDSGLKDLRAMLAEGRERGLELPLVERSVACYEEVARHGLGPADAAAVSVYWSARRGG
jgi:3-hydroxyisobutyrate dehydrogenase